MTTKQSHPHSNHDRSVDEVDYDLFCHSLEEQYQQAKEEGVFEILRVLELDKEHSDKNLVQAIDYFNEVGGAVTEDAPMVILTEREKSIVHQDGNFRAELYCMLL